MTETTTLSQAEAELRYGDQTVALPLIEGSEGEKAIDISKLRGQTGLITLDPGYANTGSCRSSITFIDGEKGILRYRGYPIDELAESSSFLEVTSLLINGELPDRAQLEALETEVMRHTMLHEDFKRFFGSLPKAAHPMPVLAAAVGALATFYDEPADDAQAREAVVRLIAKMPGEGARRISRSDPAA